MPVEHSTNHQYDFSPYNFSSSNATPGFVTPSEEWDAHKFGYRVVSPLEAQKYTSTSCFYDDGLDEEDFWIQDGGTVAYNPSHIGSSFLPQEDDLFEQEERQQSLASEVLAAEVLAAHEEWDALLESEQAGPSPVELQQRKLSLAVDVFAAHEEWDALLENEAHTPPHFEYLKEDPYFSDYEEMRPEDVREMKLASRSADLHCNMDDSYYSFDDDLEDIPAAAQ